MKVTGIDKNLRFETEIQSIEKINPLFSRATLRAFYVGSNRNGSHISKEVTENAIKSIYNIPIVGEYIEQTDNFGGHGGKIEIKDNEITFKNTTMPYGVIPESAVIKWETVIEEDGSTNEYLVIDGAYLWTGRYDELNTLLDKSFGQSMEIEVQNGNFAVVDGVETFKIDEFIFSAFCILGIDKDGEGHVEPCFEGANITAYSLDKDGFKREFNKMIAELKFSLEQGGNEMTQKENTETPEKTVLDMFTEAQFTEATEMNVAFDAVVTKPETEPSQEFALTASQLQQQLRIAIGKEKHTDQWGDTCRKYWYVDHTDTTVIVEDYQDGYQLYSVDYTLSGDVVTLQTDTASKVKVEYVPFEGESVAFSANFERFEQFEAQTKVASGAETLKTEFDSLQSNYENLQTQLDELNTYKRQREESDIKAKFEGKLSDEEFTQVFSDLKDSPLDAIEDKLFAIIGKKNFAIQSPVNTNVNKINFNIKEEEVRKPYGGLIERYAQKSN